MAERHSTHRSRIWILAAAALMFTREARAQSDARAEARSHFEKGVIAFDDRRYDEAAREFELAYTISPAFQVLYNIGQVNVALERHVQAVRAFETYLRNGGLAISPDRRAEVEAELERQRAFVGLLTIRVSPSGAELLLDGEPVGKSPLNGPIVVAPGSHLVESTSNGYVANRRTVLVAASATVSADVVLEPIPQLKDGELESRLAPTPIADAPTASMSGQQRIGYVVGAGGALLLITGGVLAIVGAGKANTAREELGRAGSGPAYDALRPAAERDYDAGSRLNEIGLIAGGLGAVTAGVGVILLVTAPAPRPQGATALVPRVSLEPRAMTLNWSW